MTFRRLFQIACLALVATSVAFSVRADILPALKTEFGLTSFEIGRIAGTGMWGFAVTMIIGSILVETVGMRFLVGLAFGAHVLGVLLTITARGYSSLYFATLLIGLAGGLVEAVINPLIATLYPGEKTKHMFLLHAWWPGGLIIGGTLVYLTTKAIGLDGDHVTAALAGLGWRLKMGFVLLPTFAYGWLSLRQQFPKPASLPRAVLLRNVLSEMKRPLFPIVLVLMMATAALDMGPDQWIGPMLRNLAGMQGILLLIFTAGIRFAIRQFVGTRLAETASPMGLLTIASVLCAGALLWLSGTSDPLLVIAGATAFGIGKAFFWPTMLGFVADRFPRGGAVLLGLLGGAAMFSAGWFMTPAMGKMQDKYLLRALPHSIEERVTTDGRVDPQKLHALEADPIAKVEIARARQSSASMTYRAIAKLPMLLTLIFGFLFFFFNGRVTYREVSAP